MKSPRRLIWKLYPSYLLITLISLAAMGLFAIDSMQQFYYDQVTDDLLASSRIIEKQILESYTSGDTENLESLCASLAEAGQKRITIIKPNGNVIAESQEDPEDMDNHSNRPEIKKAMNDDYGSNIRYSNTLKTDMLYVAIPLKQQDKVVAVLRLAKPVSAIESQLGLIFKKIFIGSFIVAFAAALLSLIVSERISKPLVKLKNGVKHLANGELNHKLPMSNCHEINSVTKAINQMAGQINERIMTVSRQRNEHKAVLSSMSEAVLAFDSEWKLITLNASAGNIIDIDVKDAKGRSLKEIIRNEDLQQFIIDSLYSSKTAEENITLHKNGFVIYLQARTNALLDENGKKIGILVVLNDITRIRQLEQVRSDFVANVSHELKTPITSIKGFVETLLEGAINEPEQAKRFLDIIGNQSNRMDAIIDDLLVLSRIEEQAGKKQIELENSSVNEVLESAINLCGFKADSKGIEIVLSHKEGLFANINVPLLEQVIVNLLDNAIKYSPEQSRIEIDALGNNGNIQISVTDFGCGIEAKYLPRLFERFFRVDKARSRKLGGTGLGLAIVKHIVDAHNGTVEVESEVGKGTRFIVKLPA